MTQQWKSLSWRDLKKYDWRLSLFIEKIKTGSPIQLCSSEYNVIKLFNYCLDELKMMPLSELSKVVFVNEHGDQYRIKDFAKNLEFGGRGVGGSVKKENAALFILNSQINEYKKALNTDSIKIKISDEIYNINYAASTVGTPKSDFHLIDIDGKETVWISHKDGKTPKDFQQWGGLSEKKEPVINKHKESQAFINDIKTKEYPNNDFPRATTLAREIEDHKLKNMSIYGNDFGKQFGRQNVTLLLQGNIKLVQSGEHFVLESFHTHSNGEKMSPEFEPVFLAIYKGDRSDFGIKGVRVVIAPRGSRKITRYI